MDLETIGTFGNGVSNKGVKYDLITHIQNTQNTQLQNEVL